MKMNFTWEVPTRIHFGTGICAKALAKEKELIQGKNILLVYTGHTLQDNGTLGKVQGGLEENKCKKVLAYCGHGTNPEAAEAEEAGHLAREQDAGLIVALGGGSAIDLAKGAISSSDTLLPIIAMPTTAGTGSELSKGAILSDKSLGLKGGIRGKNLTPKVAIVDAAFTWSMPKKLTMETGFDALAHAMESYLSKKANLHSENLSLQAIRLVGENLPKLNQNLNDHEAREKMSYASMLMGMNLYNVGNCLPHRMQYPVGAMTGTSHAAGLAALYPAWVREEYKAVPDKVTAIFQTLVQRTPSNSLKAEELMANFLVEHGLSTSLTALGVKEAQIHRLVKNIRGDLSSDPIGGEKGICEKLYGEALVVV